MVRSPKPMWFKLKTNKTKMQSLSRSLFVSVSLSFSQIILFLSKRKKKILGEIIFFRPLLNQNE